MKRRVVVSLEWLCGCLDRIPPGGGHWGCGVLGLANLSLRLDERWATGVWR